MEYLQLYYFVCIAREGNFSHAADKINVSQSSLSRAIQHLENEFNIQLINRTTRSFKLTPAGERFLQKAEKIVADFDDLQSYMSSYTATDTGEIRMGIPPVLNTIMAPLFLPNFSKQYPNINIFWDVKGSKLIQKEIIKGNLDVGLIIRPVDENKFNIHSVLNDRLVLFVPPAHRLANKKQVSIDQLANESFILLDETYQLFDNVVCACQEAGFYPKIIHCSPNWDYIVELVSLSQGITILPAPLAPHIRNDLVAIPLIGDFAEWNVIAITPPKKRIPSNIKVLIKYLYEYYN